jgi:hypothetical protein
VPVSRIVMVRGTTDTVGIVKTRRVVTSAPAAACGRGNFYLRNSSGNFAIFTAIRRASSLLSNFAAACLPAWLILEIDIGELLAVVVAYHKAGVQFLDSPRRREATFGHFGKN